MSSVVSNGTPVQQTNQLEKNSFEPNLELYRPLQERPDIITSIQALVKRGRTG